jgi:hypothetical protein
MRVSTILLNFCALVVQTGAFIAPSMQGRRDYSHLQAFKSAEEALASNDRRAFLWSTVAASLAVALPFPANAAGVDYKAVATDIADMIKKEPDWGPTLVRLAWHSSGTYDKMSKTGGSGQGTIRFKEELVHGGNAGLATTAVKWMEPIHAKYAKAGLSYADLYTLGGGKCIQSVVWIVC